MASRKPKITSDPELSHHHKSGSSVTLSQISVHPIYGTIIFPVLDHTDFYLKAAKHNLNQANEIHNKIISLPIDRSNCRMTNNQLVGEFFLYAQSVVIFSYLALEYFALDCSKTLGKIDLWKNKRLDQKIKYLICKELDIPHLPGNLCDAFGKIENRRHSLNHPKFTNIVNGSETEWDSVHVSWLVIGNYEKTYNDTIKIHGYFIEPYERKLSDLSKQETLTVKRGIRFKYPTKKSS